MEKRDFDLLRRIVLDITSTLQDGRHSNAEEWNDIADELERAQKIATTEANRLGAEQEG